MCCRMSCLLGNTRHADYCGPTCQIFGPVLIGGSGEAHFLEDATQISAGKRAASGDLSRESRRREVQDDAASKRGTVSALASPRGALGSSSSSSLGDVAPSPSVRSDPGFDDMPGSVATFLRRTAANADTAAARLAFEQRQDYLANMERALDFAKARGDAARVQQIEDRLMEYWMQPPDQYGMAPRRDAPSMPACLPPSYGGLPLAGEEE